MTVENIEHILEVLGKLEADIGSDSFDSLVAGETVANLIGYIEVAGMIERSEIEAECQLCELCESGLPAVEIVVDRHGVQLAVCEGCIEAIETAIQ